LAFLIRILVVVDVGRSRTNLQMDLKDVMKTRTSKGMRTESAHLDVETIRQGKSEA